MRFDETAKELLQDTSLTQYGPVSSEPYDPNLADVDKIISKWDKKYEKTSERSNQEKLYDETARELLE